MELGVGAHEYSLTCQILIGWKHHAICWLVWQESACDAFLLIGRALGWWAWSARDHCMHFTRENAGELGMTELTLFWQLWANYTQKKCPTPQPVTFVNYVKLLPGIQILVCLLVSRRQKKRWHDWIVDYCIVNVAMTIYLIIRCNSPRIDLLLNFISFTKSVLSVNISTQELTWTQMLSLYLNVVWLEVPYFRTDDWFVLKSYVLIMP